MYCFKQLNLIQQSRIYLAINNHAESYDNGFHGCHYNMKNSISTSI